MAAITTQMHWTAAALREIPDDRNRYEIIDGELLVTPAPLLAHQLLAKEFLLLLDPYLRAHRIGSVVFAPADVVLADDTVVEPDLFVVPLFRGRPPLQWEDVGRLLLAIEILSPGTARVDRTVKRRRYQREGVPEYWIVDGDSRLVERWRPDDERPEILTEQMEWQPDMAVPGIVIELHKLFVEVLGT